MQEGIDIWLFLAGLGIFMFGMLLLEESIRNLAGRSFKKLISRYTRGRWRALATGTVTTAILQSSSAVSLMILAFVGAGIMPMSNAIGVIIGSNLGTTVTSWLVATVGFKISIEALALPFLGIGGLGLIFFGSNSKATNFSKLLVGFGFLFMGLDYMKNSMEAFAANLDPALFVGYGVVVFFLAGFVITGLVQSSSASMAIILSIVYSGLIDYDKASAMVIGTNLGTTITVLLGAIRASTAKKRVAFSHFLFNFITALVALVLLKPLVILVFDVWDFSGDPVIGLAAFHTCFNVLGVLMFIPFTKRFADLVIYFFPEKKETHSRYISKVTQPVPEAALAALNQEVRFMLKITIYFQLKIFGQKVSSGLLPGYRGRYNIDDIKPLSHEKRFHRINILLNEILLFSAGIQQEQLTIEESGRLQALLNASRSAFHASRMIFERLPEIMDLQESDDPGTGELLKLLKDRVADSHKFIVENLEKGISDLTSWGQITRTMALKEKQFLEAYTAWIRKPSQDSAKALSLLALSRSLDLALSQMKDAGFILATEGELLPEIANHHDKATLS